MTNYDKQIELLEHHAEVANKEMGEIKVSLAKMCESMTWIKDTLNGHMKGEEDQIQKLHTKIDNIRMGMPPWMAVVGAIGSSILVGLVVDLLHK